MNKTAKKLSVNRETLRTLGARALGMAAAGETQADWSTVSSGTSRTIPYDASPTLACSCGTRCLTCG